MSNPIDPLRALDPDKLKDAALRSKSYIRAEKKATVARYWPGKAPSLPKPDDDNAVVIERGKSSRPADRRLQRAKAAARDREESIRRRRQYHEEVAEIVHEASDEEEEDKEEELEVGVIVAKAEDEEDDEETRRARALARRRAQKDEEEEELLPFGEEEDEDEEDEEEGSGSSEYETDSSAEDPGRLRIAPVFVRKSFRDTKAEAERLEEQAENLEKAKEKRRKELKEDTKQKLKAAMRDERKKVDDEDASDNRFENVQLREGRGDGGELDHDDDLDEAEEYEKWKQRELLRLKRDKEEREKFALEQLEIARRRDMSDAEILAEDKDTDKFARVKAQWKFLQKYYHTGAFFRTYDEKDDLAKSGKWDFNQPTLEDHSDKSMLPSLMQVKDFGKRGRVKWTHLVNEDTTDWESPWNTNDEMRLRYNKKMAGLTQTVVGRRVKKQRLG